MKIGTLLALLDDKTRLGSLILLLFCGAFLLLSLSIPIDSTFAEHGFSARTLPLALSSAWSVRWRSCAWRRAGRANACRRNCAGATGRGSGR